MDEVVNPTSKEAVVTPSTLVDRLIEVAVTGLAATIV